MGKRFNGSVMVGAGRKVVGSAAALVVFVSIGTGCSSSNAKSPSANAFLRTTVAEGPWPNLPATPLYMSVLDFPQPAGEKAPAGGHTHPPGFVFGLTGLARVELDDGSHVDIPPGHAIFAPPFVHHDHTDPGPGPDDWLFLGPRTEAVRNNPLPSPEAQDFFNSDTITGLVTGKDYMLKLDEVTIRPGGQSPTEREGGPTLVYVLEGQVSLHQPQKSPQILKWGQTTFLADGGVSQLRNDSLTDQAKLLVMTMWQQGQPSSTPVDSALT